MAGQNGAIPPGPDDFGPLSIEILSDRALGRAPKAGLPASAFPIVCCLLCACREIRALLIRSTIA
jgi:hypothetical protein